MDFTRNDVQSNNHIIISILSKVIKVNTFLIVNVWTINTLVSIYAEEGIFREMIISDNRQFPIKKT